MTTDHLRALLNSGIRRRTRTMVLLGAYEGFRVSEIARVRGEHIDGQSQRIYVRGKGGREDWLPCILLSAWVAALPGTRFVVSVV